MIRRIFLIATLLTVLLLAAALPVMADSPQGVIQGTIVNGTTGVLPDQPLTVTLKTYVNGSINGTTSVQASDNGTYAFTGLNTGTDHIYELQTDYSGVTFTSDQLGFTANVTQLSGNLNIYETTTDISTLSVSMGHIVIYSASLTGATDSGDTNVTEVYYISNTSDHAYTGQVSFTLPQDATPSDMGATLSWTTVGNVGAVVDNGPFSPGQTQIDFTYSLPAADSYTLDRSLALPIAQMDVLVQSGLFDVTSPQLTASTAQSMGGASFDDYTGSALAAGEPLNLTLTKKTATASGGSNTLGVWLAVIGVILIVVAGILFFRMRSPRPAPAYTGGGQGDADGGRWDELLDELAALDDQHDAGTISDEEYQAARDRAKAELKDLMGRENDGGGD